MSLAVIQSLLWITCLLALVASARFDALSRIIPNRYVLTVAAAGLAISLLSAPASVWLRVLIALALFAALATVAHFDYLGGGDVKLIAATALLAPPDRIGALLLAIALAGGLLSCVYLLMCHVQERRAVRTHDGRGDRKAAPAGRSVPYAFAILGGVCVYLVSEFYQCWSGTSCSL